MQATLAVKMDNAAFEENPAELARILRELADRVECGVSVGDKFVVRDINGNPVGALTVAED